MTSSAFILLDEALNWINYEKQRLHARLHLMPTNPSLFLENECLKARLDMLDQIQNYLLRRHFPSSPTPPPTAPTPSGDDATG